jgi:hypothetical protein
MLWQTPIAVTKETPASLPHGTLGIYLPGVVAVVIYVGWLIVKKGSQSLD